MFIVTEYAALTYSSTSSVAEMQNPDIVTGITQSKDT